MGIMLCYHGKLSLACFTVAAVLAVLPEVLLRLEFVTDLSYFKNIWLTHLFGYGFLNLLLLPFFRDFSYQVAVRAAFLGYAFGIGFIVSQTAPRSWQMFGVYIVVLTFFHYTEFLSIAWISPATLSTDSFILNHSIEYGIAAFSGWIEYVVENLYFPEMKEASWFSYIGLILCIGGEILRKLAMFTAQHNFSHVLQSKKAENHVLVTHGVYKLCRHPSYVGWFYWSIGTQLILQNPFCLLAYTLATWKFFHDRILIEEYTLVNFFGQDYVEYQKEVGTGLPFICGYKVNL